MTTNASPPTQTHAAATWTTSRTNDALPLTDAWPESAGIIVSPAAGKSAASSYVRYFAGIRGAKIANTQSAAASTVRATITWPKRVSSTSDAMFQCSAWPIPNPSAAAPWRTIVTGPSSARKPDAPATTYQSLRRTGCWASRRKSSSATTPPTERNSATKPRKRTTS